MRRGFLGHVFTVGGFTALSRVLGLVREMLQSRFIGAGVEQSAFTLAFAIPNMFRKMFGEGALTAAFVPVFKAEVETDGVAKAAKLARAVLAMVLLLLAAIVLMGLAAVGGCAAWLPRLSPRLELILTLAALLLPYMLFICGAAFGMGVLNALGKFKASSFMPTLLNLVWIAALAALAFFPEWTIRTRVIAVCAAILLGGLFQLLFMFRCMAKVGVRPFGGGMLAWGDDKVRMVWRNLGIGIAGAGAVQINYALDQVLAQCAAPWAAGVIGYAERLMDLPLGVVGVAFGTVLLPTFAGLFAKQDLEGAKRALNSSIVQLMTVMIPAAAGLSLLASEVTTVIYQGNAFDALATMRVSRALAVYALGLAFFGYQRSLIPWFQSQGDMKTPLRVSVTCVILNAALNIAAVMLLPVDWRHVGLAVSTDICAATGCVLLTVKALRKNGELGLTTLKRPIARICLATTAMTIAIIEIRPLVATWPTWIALATLILLGLTTYAVGWKALACLKNQQGIFQHNPSSHSHR